MTAQMPSPAPAPRRRWLRVVFALSLALNLFFLGFAAVAAWRHWDGRGVHPYRMMELDLRSLAPRLPEAAQDEIRAAVEAVFPALREKRERLRALRDEILTLLAAPQPDRAAIEQRLAEIRRVTGEMQDLVQQSLVEAVLKLPPEQRKALGSAE